MACSESIAARGPPPSATPRRVSRRARSARPRAQPSGHRPFGTAEVPGRVLARPPFHVAQHEDRPIPSWEPAQFLVEQADAGRPSLAPSWRVRESWPSASPDAAGAGCRREPARPSGRRRRGASCRPCPAARSRELFGPGPGRWPGTRPRRPGDPRGPADRRPGPSARVVEPGRRTRPGRADG